MHGDRCLLFQPQYSTLYRKNRIWRANVHMLLYILPESVESSGKIESISASKIPVKSTNNIINEPGQIGKRRKGALYATRTYICRDRFIHIYIRPTTVCRWIIGKKMSFILFKQTLSIKIYPTHEVRRKRICATNMLIFPWDGICLWCMP